MSVQGERELRERLGGLLDGIEPRPAPVFGAMRQGRGIRMRRWVSAAAGLAVIAGAAAALPAVLHRHPAVQPVAPLHYTVTVNPPGKGAQAGLIATGTQDGYKWQIVASGRGQNFAIHGYGISGFGGPIGGTPDPVVTAGGGGGGKGGNLTIVGLVRADVTRVALTLPGGRVLSLLPVGYLGQRYIGVAIPWDVPIFSAVAYHGSRELAYSPPRDGKWLDNWWLPGQRGPATLSKVIASGVTDGHNWRYTADIGPWGYCYNFSDGSGSCLPGLHPSELRLGGAKVQQMVCGPVATASGSGVPWTGLAAAGPGVRQVWLSLSDGSTERITTADVAGTRMFGFGVRHGLKIVSTTEYGASGQVVGTTPGSAVNCP